jgi:hypothetical protein
MYVLAEEAQERGNARLGLSFVAGVLIAGEMRSLKADPFRREATHKHRVLV